MTTLNEAISAVEPFTSGDETRPHLCRPFGAKLGRAQYLAATDGHTAGLVRCEDAAGVVVPGSPPIDYVIPKAARRIGEIGADLEAMRELPRSWNCNVVVTGEGCRLYASRIKGSGKRERSIKLLDGVPFVPGLRLDSGFTMSINAAYLLRAVDLIGTMVVHVWPEPSKDGLGPYVFTPTTDPILEARAFAIVMPVRV